MQPRKVEHRCTPFYVSCLSGWSRLFAKDDTVKKHVGEVVDGRSSTSLRQGSIVLLLRPSKETRYLLEKHKNEFSF